MFGATITVVADTNGPTRGIDVRNFILFFSDWSLLSLVLAFVRLIFQLAILWALMRVRRSHCNGQNTDDTLGSCAGRWRW